MNKHILLLWKEIATEKKLLQTILNKKNLFFNFWVKELFAYLFGIYYKMGGTIHGYFFR